MSKAYIETTVLTNLLIKPGSSLCSAAYDALKRLDSTLLPVYAIKEWKAGPLDHYAYVHDKLLTTRSLAATIEAIHHLYRSPYKRSTSEEAIVAACRLDATVPWSRADYTSHDEENADRFRLALATLIKRSWRQRRRVATATIQDLDCYTEAEPKLDKRGLFDFKPKDCDPERECCLAAALKAAPHLLS